MAWPLEAPEATFDITEPAAHQSFARGETLDLKWTHSGEVATVEFYIVSAPDRTRVRHIGDVAVSEGEVASCVCHSSTGDGRERAVAFLDGRRGETGIVRRASKNGTRPNRPRAGPAAARP